MFVVNRLEIIRVQLRRRPGPLYEVHPAAIVAGLAAFLVLFFLDKIRHFRYIIVMRIIAGTKKGMRLLSPKMRISRPITDRVKESLFSVLYKYNLPAGARVADLFCGVGSLGLEALSRGAEFVTFVEKDPKVFAILNKNIEKAGFGRDGSRTARTIRANAFNFCSFEGSGMEKPGLVFVDPPYAAAMNVRADSPLGGLLQSLNEHVIDDGIIVVRTREDVNLLEQYGQFQIAERRKWGTMAVSMLMKTESER